MRLLRPGLKAVRYTGKIKTKFRGAAEGRSYVEIKPCDIALVSDVTAVRLCRGTQYEIVDTDVDITSLMADRAVPTVGMATNEELLGELASRGVIEHVDVVGVDPYPTENNCTSDECHNEPDTSLPGQDTEKAPEKAKAAEEDPEVLREATKENVMELNEKEVKAACKKYGIAIGKKKIDALVSLLLPFLEVK